MMGICCVAQGTQGLYDNLEGGIGREMGGRLWREGHGCTYGWFLLMYATKFCKANIFPLKKSSEKKKEIKERLPRKKKY